MDSEALPETPVRKHVDPWIPEKIIHAKVIEAVKIGAFAFHHRIGGNCHQESAKPRNSSLQSVKERAPKERLLQVEGKNGGLWIVELEEKTKMKMDNGNTIRKSDGGIRRICYFTMF